MISRHTGEPVMKNWTPFGVAVLVIVVTQICCTWAIVNKLNSSDTSELTEISSTLDKIESHTEATAHETERVVAGVEYLGETPEERQRDLQQRIRSTNSR
jgi:uncharacterized protein YoxC